MPSRRPSRRPKVLKPRQQFGKVHLKFWATLAVVLAVFASFVSQPVSASGTITRSTTDANDFYFKSFTADYYLSRDADGKSRMKVVEELTAVFPETDQNYGITRVIPFTNNDGKNLTMASDRHLKIAVLRNGEKEKIDDIIVSDGYFKVQIGNANRYVHGEQTYTLTYEFENLILSEDEHGYDWQELYWDTNGNDWRQRFDEVTARVHFDAAAKAGFDSRVACYVGRYGQANIDRCKIEPIDDGFMFTASKLQARENLTFVIGFEANTFKTAPKHYNFTFMIILAVLVALAFITILIYIRAYYSVDVKRRFYKDLFVKPEYTPPRSYTVAEMADLYIGKGKKGDAKVATLLELAVRHKIELVKGETKGLLGKKREIWKVRVLDTDLKPEQTKILQILAGSKVTLQEKQEIEIKTHTSSSTLVSLAKGFDTDVEAANRAEGLTEPKKIVKDGKKVRNWGDIAVTICAIWIFVLTVAMALCNGIGSTPYSEVVGEGVAFAASILICLGMFAAGIVIYGKVNKFYTRTEKGLEMARYLEGLYLYIRMAEAERLNFLQSVKGADTSNAGIVKLYEKLLPYACLFGFEKSWLNTMGKYYEMQDVGEPAWYVGASTFSAIEFSRALSAASSSASSTFAHSGVSSSSSGGSGFSGGFSGGGGGGGGGGGW